MSWKTSSLLSAAVLALSGGAQAALVVQPNALEVLDTDAQLLWLQVWDARTSVSFPVAEQWAAGLTVGGAVPGAWRLPNLVELQTLWTASGADLVALDALFTGVMPGPYWIGPSLPPYPDVGCDLRSGFTCDYIGQSPMVANAVAVRSSVGVDVWLGQAPEPATLPLTLAALAGACSLRRSVLRR